METQRQKRETLRIELRQNIEWDKMKVKQHKPWTHVCFNTCYAGPKGGANWINLWGVSKICWPDQWEDDEGIGMAISRALGWAITDLIPPIEDPGLNNVNKENSY